jgi:hypothetical protein
VLLNAALERQAFNYMHNYFDDFYSGVMEDSEALENVSVGNQNMQVNALAKSKVCLRP